MTITSWDERWFFFFSSISFSFSLIDVILEARRYSGLDGCRAHDLQRKKEKNKGLWTTTISLCFEVTSK